MAMSNIFDVIKKEFIIVPAVLDLLANPETIVFPMGDDGLAISASNGQLAFLFMIASDGVKLAGVRAGEREIELAEPEAMPARTAERLRLVLEAVLEMEVDELIPADKVEDGDVAATMAAVKKALAAKAAKA